VFPRGQAGLTGPTEADAFARLKPVPRRRIGRMCELALFGMLPALTNPDPHFNEFCEYLHRFNRLAGAAYAAIQGAPYSSAEVADLIVWLRGIGIRGVGQSSWGPAVFALTRSDDEALALADRIRAEFRLPQEQVLIAAANNQGASVHTE
jgi:predicted sugar kinase